MRKFILLIAIMICTSAAANAYMINLSCKAVQGVSPDFFINDPNGWDEYVAILEKAYCGNTDTDKEEEPNPSETPGEQ